MTEGEFEAELLRRKVAFEPWNRKTPEMLVEQAVIQRVLSRLCGATFGEDCYVSPDAYIGTDKLVLGAGTFIASGAIVRGHVSLGANCSVNPYVHISGLVKIGSDVRIAPGVGIYGFNHGSDRLDVRIREQPITVSGIEIGEDSWIGANALITDGVNIGPHCIVAAGSVVTKTFPAYQVIGGNPAKVLQDRRDRPRP